MKCLKIAILALAVSMCNQSVVGAYAEDLRDLALEHGKGLPQRYADFDVQIAVNKPIRPPVNTKVEKQKSQLGEARERSASTIAKLAEQINGFNPPTIKNNNLFFNQEAFDGSVMAAVKTLPVERTPSSIYPYKADISSEVMKQMLGKCIRYQSVPLEESAVKEYVKKHIEDILSTRRHPKFTASGEIIGAHHPIGHHYSSGPELLGRWHHTFYNAEKGLVVNCQHNSYESANDCHIRYLQFMRDNNYNDNLLSDVKEFNKEIGDAITDAGNFAREYINYRCNKERVNEAYNTEMQGQFALNKFNPLFDELLTFGQKKGLFQHSIKGVEKKAEASGYGKYTLNCTLNCCSAILDDNGLRLLKKGNEIDIKDDQKFKEELKCRRLLEKAWDR